MSNFALRLPDSPHAYAKKMAHWYETRQRYDVVFERDGFMILRRKIYPGLSISRICTKQRTVGAVTQNPRLS